MELGAFSVSLAVQDIAASQRFYEKFGFAVFGGDVRELQRRLRAAGVEFVQEADETTTGPASFIATDPDGNPILVDQHV